MKAFPITRRHIVDFLKMALLAALIAAPTLFVFPYIYSFLQYKISNYCISTYCPEIIPHTKMFRELIEQDLEKTRELIATGEIDIKAIWECERKANKIIFNCFAVLLFLLLIFFAYITALGFFSKNPIINSGLVIGGLLSSFLIIMRDYEHAFYDSRAPFLVSLVLAVGCTSALMYAYNISLDRLKQLKQNKLLFAAREIIIIIFLASMLSAISYMITRELLSLRSYIPIVQSLSYSSLNSIITLCMMMILAYIGWMLHIRTFACAFFGATGLYLNNSIFINLRNTYPELARLEYRYLGSTMRSLFRLFLVLLIPIMLYLAKKKFKK